MELKTKCAPRREVKAGGGVGCQAAGQLKPKRGDVNQSFPGANGRTGIQWQKVINLNEGRETNHKYSSINMDPLISF